MSVAYPTPKATVALRPGPHGLPRRQVAEIQRGRMVAALMELLNDGGVTDLTVTKLVGRARVSRNTFYCVFTDREDCLLAAFEKTLARGQILAVDAYDREPDWRQGIRAALACLLALMDEEPAAARLCLIETVTAGERVQARRSEMLADLAYAIDAGRTASSVGRGAPGLTAETVVGGACAVIEARLREHRARPLIELLGPLMSMIVLPYLGPSAARRETRLATPRSRPRTVKDKDPLQEQHVRLTYRTVRVLRAVAEHPGASNRLVAEQAGISDPGQISKLMRRLERLGLIENEGLGQPQGASNAWRLTTLGARVERSTRTA